MEKKVEKLEQDVLFLTGEVMRLEKAITNLVRIMEIAKKQETIAALKSPQASPRASPRKSPREIK